MRLLAFRKRLIENKEKKEKQARVGANLDLQIEVRRNGGMCMIRKFERADTEQVMGIWLEANLEAHAFIPGEYWRSQYEAVEEQLSQAEIYVYEREQNIRGFAGMVGDYLAGIFVDGKCRCAGIGRSLLTCIKRNYPAFSLHVYQKNRRAVDFYLREGLSVVSEGVDEDTKEADYTMEWKE